MAALAHEPLDDVLDHYGVRVVDIRNESYKGKKGVWWIKTDKGMEILKKVSNSEQTLQFIIEAIRHLTDNGTLFPEIRKTVDGKDYVCINGICCVLTQAIDGRNPVYASPGELALVAGALAKLHAASTGFHPSAGTKPKYHLGLWVEDYTQQLEEIKEYCENKCLNNRHDAANSVILSKFPYFYERAERAIKGLKGKDYADWVGEAEEKGCLCHQDFAAGNLLITASGRLYVLDTDSLTVDIAARDIRKLLNKVMKKNGSWDAELAKRVLHHYQAGNPLNASQWEVVRLDLTYPHLFLGAVHKYCHRRDKEWSEEKYLQRIAEMSAFEKTAEPVLENFKSVIPI